MSLAWDLPDTLDQPPWQVDVFLEAESLQPAWQEPVARLCRRLPDLLRATLAQIQGRAILQAAGLQDEGQLWEVELTWTDNARIQALNAQYRSQDKPTDVLTFCLYADSPLRSQLAQLPVVQLGGVFVSVEWAVQEAAATAQPLEQYLAERVVHGLLHLLGQNHDTMQDYQTVVAIQKQVLAVVFENAR